MRSLSLLSLAAILASAAACSDESIPLDKIADRLAAVTCADMFECCDPGERAQQLQIFDPQPMTEAECVTTLAAFYRALLINNETVTSGRLHYDGERWTRVPVRVDPNDPQSLIIA